MRRRAMEVKNKVRRFWNSSPCGTYLAKHKEGTLGYYKEIDRLRYNQMPYAYSYLPKVAGFADYKGKMVLEIGCGVGTDLSQFARNGATVTGVDLTPKGIELAKKRFKVMGLRGTLLVADAEDLPFPDNSFDMVYSFGVLHHTPDTQKAINEAHRVLKPRGRAVIMLYHKTSFEYLTHIVRKIINPSRWGWSLDKAISYQTEMNKDPKGPTNPLTKTYTQKEAKALFKRFRVVRTSIYWLRIPVFARVIPGFMTYIPSRCFGWHVIIKAVK
jgi:ubiquinone/menaquinone biosynthesis C-methylase UbiE